MKNKAILVVSYGTSHKEAMEKSIEAIEKRIQEEFQEYKIYRAFTGKRGIKKLSQTGTAVMTLAEALERMKKDGIQELVVQPTYVTNGIENEKMIEKVRAASEEFQSITIGKPLLNDWKDCRELSQIVAKECVAEKNEILMLMAHGTKGGNHLMYLKLEEIWKDMGHENIVIGTMKGIPSFEDAKKQLENLDAKKIILQPFMIVAGEHAKKDMAGKEDSWKCELEKKGYKVECHMKGLGELSKVQEMFVRHIKEVI